MMLGDNADGVDNADRFRYVKNEDGPGAEGECRVLRHAVHVHHNNSVYWDHIWVPWLWL